MVKKDKTPESRLHFLSDIYNIKSVKEILPLPDVLQEHKETLNIKVASRSLIAMSISAFLTPTGRSVYTLVDMRSKTTSDRIPGSFFYGELKNKLPDKTRHLWDMKDVILYGKVLTDGSKQLCLLLKLIKKSGCKPREILILEGTFVDMDKRYKYYFTSPSLAYMTEIFRASSMHGRVGIYLALLKNMTNPERLSQDIRRLHITTIINCGDDVIELMETDETMVLNSPIQTIKMNEELMTQQGIRCLRDTLVATAAIAKAVLEPHQTNILIVANSNDYLVGILCSFLVEYARYEVSQAFGHLKRKMVVHFTQPGRHHRVLIETVYQQRDLLVKDPKKYDKYVQHIVDMGTTRDTPASADMWSEKIKKAREKSATKAEWQKTVHTLKVLCQNIISDPDNEKYRAVKASQPRIFMMWHSLDLRQILMLAGWQYHTSDHKIHYVSKDLQGLRDLTLRLSVGDE